MSSPARTEMPVRLAAGAMALLAAFGPLASAGVAADPAPRYEKRWVWVMSNLLVDAEADRVSGIIATAAKSGFNGIVLSDYKCNFLGRMPERYFANVKRVLKTAEQAKVEIIPCLFPIGYSNGLLTNDVNLAEGLPVKAAPYRVKNGKALPIELESAKLKNGGLEETRGDAFVGFGYQDNPGKCTFADRSVAHSGRVSCRMENFAAGPVCRLIQKVKVRPGSCWRISCWVKTEGFQNVAEFRLHAGGGSGRQLTFHEGGIRETQDWTKLSVVFNSLGETEVNLYAGTWGGKSGKLWIDDLTFEEVSFMNILRRDGCPLTVASADGTKTYREGTDFKPLVDPKLGRVPYEGEYDFDHPGPDLALEKGSRIKEGDKIVVSFYHPVPTHGANVACCLSEPKVYELLRDQAQRVNDLFRPKAFFMQHDELRVANWCAACSAKGLSAGALLAENARKCVAILNDVNPRPEVFVWSDMFDPNHNAVDNYYLVNGSFKGSWEGLASRVIIANWNGGGARKSLSFFAERGHRQLIAGYYDSDDNFKTWDAQAQATPKIFGFMYTTWQNKYEDLARYGELLRGGE